MKMRCFPASCILTLVSFFIVLRYSDRLIVVDTSNSFISIFPTKISATYFSHE